MRPLTSQECQSSLNIQPNWEFVENLTWWPHVESVIKKACWKLSDLRETSCRQSFYPNPDISVLLMLKCVVDYDHKQDSLELIDREKLDIQCRWAPPKQWAKYVISSLLIKILRNSKRVILHQIFKETLYNERRDQHRGQFYDNSKSKVGRQKLEIHGCKQGQVAWQGPKWWCNFCN